MRETYITLFDGGFLPHGLALHRSLERHAGHYRLWVIAMDELAGTALRRLELPNVEVLDLAEVENDRLRGVRADRTVGEYCWTLTPFTPEIALTHDPEADRATYLDADLWFVRSPAPLFAELERADRAVLITDHAYTPEYDQSGLSGRFCVQFMPFVRDRSDTVAHWWQDRVIEWCYARFEDGRFGDQKYLDDWPERFPDSVHVLGDMAATQAPWNAGRFNPADAVLFHFHELRTMAPNRVRLGHYRIPAPTLDLVYRPYLADLGGALDDLASVGIHPPVQRPGRGPYREAKDWLALRGLDRRPPRSPLTARLPRVVS